jgi:hypothetical protein
MGYYGLNNMTKVKIVEPNKRRHIAFAGDIHTIVVSKDDTGGTYSFIEAKVKTETNNTKSIGSSIENEGLPNPLNL